jgi:ribosome-associated translation inhibitor RaiA
MTKIATPGQEGHRHVTEPWADAGTLDEQPRPRLGSTVVGELPDRREPRVTSPLDNALRLGAGFQDDDRPWLLDALSALSTHLARWDPSEVEAEISVKDRDGKEQQVTLRLALPGYPPLVAKVVDRNLVAAIAEVKRQVIRQVEDEKSKREPKDNRLLRKRKP